MTMNANTNEWPGIIGGQPLQGLLNGNNNNNNNNRNSNRDNRIILRTWTQPPNGVTQWAGTNEEMKKLFDTLPKELSEHLIQMFPPDVLVNLTEIYLQLGQIPECVVSNKDKGGRSERRKCNLI